MSHEWSDALQWRGNKSLESGREEEKRENCHELINDKIFVYRCNTCLLVFTCVHSFSNHVLSENHQIKQLNSLKKGKYFNCLRCKYVCLSIAKMISHIELYNHGHNILRKIKRNMIYNGIASCSCPVKCYTFYSQNKNCLTTGDPIVAEYEGVPNLQPIDAGGMCPSDQSDSHYDGDLELLPKEGGIPPKERNLLLMGHSNDLIPLFPSTDFWGRGRLGGNSLRRKTLGFILSTTGGEASKETVWDASKGTNGDASKATNGGAFKSPSNATAAAQRCRADMKIAPMPCNQVGEQTELSPICTDINKINDFNAVLLNLEKQEQEEKQKKQKNQRVRNEGTNFFTDATRNLLLHIYENNYHLSRMNGKDSFPHDADYKEKRSDILAPTEGQLFSSPSGLNKDNTFTEKNYDPFRSYGYNPFEQGAFSLFGKEDNASVGTRGEDARFFTHQGGHPQSGANNPDRKDAIGMSITSSDLHEADPSNVIDGRDTRKNSTQNRPPHYDPIIKDHHNLDQFLSSEVANKVHQNMEGEMEEIKNSFLRSIQNSEKKLAALDTLYLYEQWEGASLFCSNPSTAYGSTKEAQTSVSDEIDTHRNGTPRGMHSLDEQQMGGFLNRDKFSPSDEDLKKYFCKNFLPHIFDYQPRSMVPPAMGGVQRHDSGEPSYGKVAKVMGDAHMDARHDMRVVTANKTHNMAERKTPNRETFTEMKYPPRQGATDAALYLTQRIHDSGSFLTSKYWQSEMDEMDRGPYKHIDGKDNRELSGVEVEATNQLDYRKYTVGRDQHSGDPHAASLFPQIDSALTYMNKKRNDNVTEERAKKESELDLLTFYGFQGGGRSPYVHNDVQKEGTSTHVQNGQDDRFYPQLNKASHHFNQPYEDLIQYGKRFRGCVAEEENGEGEKPFNTHDEPISFTANAGFPHKGVRNPNAQSDAAQQVALTEGMNQCNATAKEFSAPSSSVTNFNARPLSRPSRDTSVSNPTNNAASRTQEQILNNIFEDPSDDKKRSRTSKETAALNQKRQSFIDEIGEIKKSIEKENKNNRQPNLTHMSPPY
ncbi:hypothetical protein C922_04540 [Plasmodium inui San Antonio 1]|uniref:C2H2-type domain-containing protein n=1 Tax=Plasmodium inui San Antonio 1 TaxID=1237626 RepID=W7A7G1_9APIC|nr:hypothetical protein C922_04540 [Plasmodium inui San Antonio 1]EUD65029.1 hypothetical protein C922_04540 [Plasmodium inui San Antonio 1]